MNWNNEVTFKFIEAYRDKNVLWNPGNKEYFNRNAKQQAWDELSEEMGCPVPDLKKKMDYLLSALRREKAKIKRTRAAGKGADDVYRSNWCFFKYLQFLVNRNKPRSRTNSVSRDDESETSVSSQVDHITVKIEPGQQSPDPLSPAPRRSSNIPPPQPPAKKQRVVGTIAKQNHLLSLACKYLKQAKAPRDERPIIAKVWGEKLLALDQTQRLFAEKAINDILFEASLGFLHRYSVKINEDSCA